MRVKSTDDAELSLLYEAVVPELWRALFAYTRDRDIASDAAAESFAQYIRRRDEVTSPRGWLWKAAFRIAAGELQRTAGRVDAEPHVTDVSPDVDHLQDVLAGLSERQRAVTVLRYYAGYEPSEIASILGLGPSTVRVHLLRARRRLAKLMEGDDEH